MTLLTPRLKSVVSATLAGVLIGAAALAALLAVTGKTLWPAQPAALSQPFALATRGR
jgi:hypothetical protein